jgi:DNA polymerase-4
MVSENPKKIIHIDMDAFFASVEQRDHPELQGKPVVVGDPGPRGVIAAASYEARKYGIHSAMASKTALKLCPQLIFAGSNFSRYKEVSKQIRLIFLEYTDLVEPLSLDEAFIDVTENRINLNSATLIAKQIKKKIKEQTELTASAGVSYNKFLAKIASDYDKPDGLFVITPDDAEKFIEELAIEKFYGVGKVTSKKMNALGIKNGLDLKQKSLEFLIKNFGKSGEFFYTIARGIDHREVNPNYSPKSIGAERTFDTDIYNIDEILRRTEEIAHVVMNRCHKSNTFGSCLTLKIKYADFKQITRSKSVNFKIQNINTLINLAFELSDQVNFTYQPVRLIGISVSNLDNQHGEAFQLNINFKE